MTLAPTRALHDLPARRRRARRSARMVASCTALGLIGVLALGAASAGTAHAVTSTTGSCRDGGGVTWKTVVKWGATYRLKGSSVTHVMVDFAGWTTKAGVVRADSTVRTYSNGRLTQTLNKTAAKNFRSATVFDARNPLNPVSAPGKTKVAITVGRDNDGKGGCTVTHVQEGLPQVTNAARRILGPTRSGLGWHSGAWVGGRFNTKTINAFGTWRGRPTDVVTTFSARSSYAAMMNDSWSISTWKGYAGKLNYGLAMLPDNGAGSLKTIAAGKQDAVWRKVAANLKNNGRGTSVVRIGWESNLRDWRWHATAANAAQYKAAYRRIVKTMRTVAPGLKFDFGVGCGAGLIGSNNRMAPLTAVYPGNDVVDLIGCDTYDWWNTHATSASSWKNVLHPSAGPGIQDVVSFARAHGKGATFPEWGLARRTGGNNGGGDNAYYVEAMFRFFNANKATVAFECYFDEPDSYIANSLYGAGQNKSAAAAYRRLW